MKKKKIMLGLVLAIAILSVSQVMAAKPQKCEQPVVAFRTQSLNYTSLPEIAMPDGCEMKAYKPFLTNYYGTSGIDCANYKWNRGIILSDVIGYMGYRNQEYDIINVWGFKNYFRHRHVYLCAESPIGMDFMMRFMSIDNPTISVSPDPDPAYAGLEMYN